MNGQARNEGRNVYSQYCQETNQDVGNGPADISPL